ncbi:MAG TPA: potassium channel family protein [Gemmatimonadales bacterium]|jgi:hypothetical protein|nr:potassium channel family protein [Gemmatimonadales bacterium]
MHMLIAVVGVLLLVGVLRDAFETIILPRRISRRFRLTNLVYRLTWRPWRAVAEHFPPKVREGSLSWFGPISLFVLLIVWASSIILAFGLIHWADGSAVHMATGIPDFGNDVYLSGTTFFTLGMGDVTPISTFAKAITVIEAGLGFAFLAIVIGYIPVIYQNFSRREWAISLLDARAGSPPCASELLWRHRDDEQRAELVALLADWERWSAEVLESHLSYPVLAYFRSQHTNQSWLAALTTILDSSALVMVGLDGWCMRQAELTFAMARHAAVDLAQVFNASRPSEPPDRLSDADYQTLITRLEAGGMRFRSTGDVQARLGELREMYEPYVAALSNYLAIPLPTWVRQIERPDNWQGAPWGSTTRPLRTQSRRERGEEHF